MSATLPLKCQKNLGFAMAGFAMPNDKCPRPKEYPSPKVQKGHRDIGHPLGLGRLSLDVSPALSPTVLARPRLLNIDATHSIFENCVHFAPTALDSRRCTLAWSLKIRLQLRWKCRPFTWPCSPVATAFSFRRFSVGRSTVSPAFTPTTSGLMPATTISSIPCKGRSAWFACCKGAIEPTHAHGSPERLLSSDCWQFFCTILVI